MNSKNLVKIFRIALTSIILIGVILGLRHLVKNTRILNELSEPVPTSQSISNTGGLPRPVPVSQDDVDRKNTDCPDDQKIYAITTPSDKVTAKDSIKFVCPPKKIIPFGEIIPQDNDDIVIFGQVMPPKGYRYPIDSDRTGDWKTSDKNELKAGYPFHAKADYNGDGYDDDAWILIKDGEPGWGLFVSLNNQSEAPLVVALYRSNGVGAQGMGVFTKSKGVYPTACGKGYWVCGKDEPEKLHTQYPTINFVNFEKSDSIFWWDIKSGKFIETWMSD